jgi:hypothetical protein
MSALAQKIASETNLFSSVETLFIKYQTRKLLRPWDVSDWDSYKQP